MTHVQFVVVFAVLVAPSLAAAQEPESTPEDQTDLAKQVQNPVADLVSVPLQFNFNSGGDLGARSNLILNVQPVVPMEVTKEWNVIARTIAPIVDVPAPGGGSDSGLADIVLQLFVTPRNATRLVWGIGPVFSFPTATVDALSTGSWAIGPAGVLVLTTGPWVLGLLATQAWTFADFGSDRDVNRLLIQPFLNFNLGSGWALTTAPIITADWNLPGDDWTVPLGGGVSWTTKIGGQAMNLAAHYYYNVTRPDFGPQNQLRLVVAFLFPKEKPKQTKVAAVKPQ
jgi:hypothetical protein